MQKPALSHCLKEFEVYNTASVDPIGNPVVGSVTDDGGTVIAVGHMVSKNSECPIKEGDYVLYQRYSGLNVKWAGEDFHVVMANDLVAVLNKDIDTTFEISDHA